MEKTKPRIRVGRTEMDFHNQGKVLTAVHPFYGPANSFNLLRQIRGSPENQTGLVEPTSVELTSFVHEYFDSNEPQARDVNKIIRDNYFRGFTGILYLPQKKVAHFIDYPGFNREGVIDRDNLLARLSESRAQVSFEHLKEGPVEWEKIGKHPYFVAWAGGKEGAEKLAELASKHPRKEAYIFVPGLSDLSKPIARIATLDSSLGDVRLGVDSDDLGDDVNCLAFGVLK